MRTAFIKTITELADRDARVTLVVGDLGFGVVTDFARRYPNQFLNAGVAEQNMTGVAAGMALAGRIVFTYSIGNFPTLRCLEQIRNDICYHKANVVVTAVGGGFAYGALGMSHHATEDLAILRALPEITVIAPGDPLETAAAVRAAAAGIGPVYLRLGRAGESNVHQEPLSWTLGKAITVRSGTDLTIIATGGMLLTAVEAAERLAKEGISAGVLSMHTLKPLDADAVLAAARRAPLLVTLEEHSILGGLGGAVAEALCEADLPRVRFRRLGLPSSFDKIVGDQEYLCACYGLDAASVCKRLRQLHETTHGDNRRSQSHDHA
jgi:transketolase